VLRLCAAFKKFLDEKNTSYYGTSYLISFTKDIFVLLFNHKNTLIYLIKKNMSAYSSLQLQNKIALTTLETIANHQIGNKPLPIEQFDLTPSDIKITAEGEKLVVKAGLKGAFSGNITIKAIPKYNTKTKDIDFKDMELNLDGKGLKSQGIAMFASDKILEELQKAIKIPIKIIVENINAQIKNNEIQPGLLLKSSIIDYNVDGISISPKSLNFQLNADVITTVEVKDGSKEA